MVRRGLALTLCLAAACSGDGSPQNTTPGKGTGSGVGSATPGTPGQVTVSTHRRGGTPHHAVIDLVALSADGKVAVSRDAIGEWRVWPALDGTLPTQRIPLTTALDAVVSTTPTGFLVAAVDAADGLELIQLGPDGNMMKRTKLPPEPGILHVVLVGDRVIASRADHSVVVLDADAKPRGTLSLRGARVEALIAAGKDRAIAMLRKSGTTPTFEARWIKLAAKVEWGDVIALPSPIADGADLALSSDQRLLAYATTPLPPPPAQPTRPAAGEAEAPRAPPPPPAPPTTVQIAIVDLQKGTTFAVGEPNSFATTVVLGFMTARDLMVVDQAQGSRIAIDVDKGTTATFGDGLPVRTGPTAFAPGVAAAGQLANLVVVGSDGSVKYLGHKDSAPTTGSISPSGRTAAWLSTAGSLIVERFDEETEHVIMPDNHTTFSLVELIDDATVIVLSNQSVLQMFDVDSGAALGDTPVTAAAAMQYNGVTKLLLVPSGNTVWIYALDRTSATPFGKRMVVPESSAFLLDPDTAGGAVLLGSDGGSIRKYTLDELRAGVSRAMARDGRITLPTPLYIFDRTGRPYNIAWRAEAGVNGRYLETWPADGKTDPWNPKGTVIAKIADDVSAAIPAPSGNRYIAYDNRGTLMLYDTRGAVTWSAAMPTMPTRIAWSDDGNRLLVVSQSGGEIFDAATGESLERACGWRFMADSSPPLGAPMGVSSVCTAPVRR
jgi:hypothetical protein